MVASIFDGASIVIDTSTESPDTICQSELIGERTVAVGPLPISAVTVQVDGKPSQSKFTSIGLPLVAPRCSTVKLKIALSPGSKETSSDGELLSNCNKLRWILLKQRWSPCGGPVSPVPHASLSTQTTPAVLRLSEVTAIPGGEPKSSSTSKITGCPPVPIFSLCQSARSYVGPRQPNPPQSISQGLSAT